MNTKKFVAVLIRTTAEFMEVSVHAKNEVQARSMALDMTNDDDVRASTNWSMDGDEYRVGKVTEVAEEPAAPEFTHMILRVDDAGHIHTSSRGTLEKCRQFMLGAMSAGHKIEFGPGVWGAVTPGSTYLMVQISNKD